MGGWSGCQKLWRKERNGDGLLAVGVVRADDDPEKCVQLSAGSPVPTLTGATISYTTTKTTSDTDPAVIGMFLVVNGVRQELPVAQLSCIPISNPLCGSSGSFNWEGCRWPKTVEIVANPQCRDGSSRSGTITIPVDITPEITYLEAKRIGVDIGLKVEHQGPAQNQGWNAYAIPSGKWVASGHITGPVGGNYNNYFEPPSDMVGVVVTLGSCDGGPFATKVAMLDEGNQQCQSEADDCASCSQQCVGDPIRPTTGNMRYREADPLPGNPTFRLTRTFNSRSDEAGAFGHGWSSVFDAGVLQISHAQDFDEHPDAGPWTAVMLTDEAGDHKIFTLEDGAYTSQWPRNEQSTVTLTNTGSTWVLRNRKSDTERIFDGTSGRLISIRSVRDDQGVDISYDSSGHPEQIADRRGNWVLNFTTSSGRVTGASVAGHSELSWTYEYDAGGNLTHVVDPTTENWRSYSYDTEDNLTEVHDVEGALLEAHEYDEGDRAITSSGPSAEITALTDVSAAQRRNSDEVVTRIDYANGSQALYYSRSQGGSWKTVEVKGLCSTCSTQDAVRVFDFYGNVTREQDGRGYIRVASFDGLGRLVTSGQAYRPSTCDPSTDSGHCRLDPGSLKTVSLTPTPATKEIARTYGDANWPDRPTAITSTSIWQSSATRSETFVYDAASGETLTHALTGYTGQDHHSESHTTTTVLYGTGVTTAFNPGGAFQTSWMSLPQPAGKVKSVDGPRTDVNDATQYVYYPIDSAVPAAWRGRLAAMKNAAGHTTRFEDYDVFGNATKVIDPNGVITLRTYDFMGRLLTNKLKGISGCDTGLDALCATDLTSTSTYSSSSGPLASSTTPEGRVTVYGYDGRGRMTSIARGSAINALKERRDSLYDATTGVKTSESLVDISGSTPVTKHFDSFEYDGANRLTTIEHSDTSTIAYTYDPNGNVLGVKDENHSTANTVNEYDSAGRLSAVRQKLGSGTIETSYEYDRDGNLVSVTDPNGNETTYAFDDFGRLMSQVSPVTGTTTYQYDVAGNQTLVHDANGAETARQYDLLNRVTNASTTRPGRAAEASTWTYDGSASAFGIGKLMSITEPTGSTAFSYERRGLLRREDRTIGASSYTTRFTYDADGNRTEVVYPSTRSAVYTFDYAGRPYSVTSGGTSIISSTAYLPFGPPTEMAFGNGTTKTTNYDPRYRPLENKLIRPSSTLADYDYDVDAAGNITAIHDLGDTTYNRSFAYDDLNRLTAANTGTSLWGSGIYSYDAMGNLQSLSLGSSRSATFNYSGTTPKLSSVTENSVNSAVTYDPAGNETAAGSATSRYSSRNFLQKSGANAFAYDSRGVRSITSTPILDLTFPAETLTGSNSITGTVTLLQPAPSGGATIALVSSNIGVLTVPASITITQGQNSGTFSATTFAIPAATLVSVTASWSGAASIAMLNVTPGSWDVTSVSLDPSDALAAPGTPPRSGPEAQTTATVTLNGTAPAGGLRVAITCGDGECPSTVTVPASSSSTTFTVIGAPPPPTMCISPAYDCSRAFPVQTTFLTSHSATFTVHTLDDGSWGGSTGLDLRSGLFLSGFSVAPKQVIGGSALLITLDLSLPAPKDGVSVSLSSNDPAIELPARMLIPEGQRSVTFSVSTGEVDRQSVATLEAEALGVVRHVEVTLQPARHKPLALSFSGRLVSTTYSASGSPERHSLYTPELNLMAETDLSLTPALAYEYIWFNGQPVAQIDLAGPTVHWTFADHLGTPIIQTDATGAIDWRAEYEPYGKVFSFRAGSSRHQPLRFPGQEHDDAMPERSYNVFRWYRAGWGRYTQSDPLHLVPTIFGVKNLYSYADANPVEHLDRLGLYSIDKGCSDTCGPDNLTSCYGNPQKIPCIKGLIGQMKQKVFFDSPCRKALEAAGKWQQVAGSLMPSAPFPRIACNKADCVGSEPRYYPASRSIPMCKWFFAYSPPAGAQSMLHEFLHDAGVGDETQMQKNILTSCFPGMAP